MHALAAAVVAREREREREREAMLQDVTRFKLARHNLVSRILDERSLDRTRFGKSGMVTIR